MKRQQNFQVRKIKAAVKLRAEEVAVPNWILSKPGFRKAESFVMNEWIGSQVAALKMY